MADVGAPEELQFEVITPLGFRVRVTRAYWDIIVGFKHPVMAAHEQAVKETLEKPSEIRLSKSDPSVHLYTFSIERNGASAGFVRLPSGSMVKAF